MLMICQLKVSLGSLVILGLVLRQAGNLGEWQKQFMNKSI